MHDDCARGKGIGAWIPFADYRDSIPRRDIGSVWTANDCGTREGEYLLATFNVPYRDTQVCRV